MVFGALRHLLPSFPALGTHEAARHAGRRIEKEDPMSTTGTVKFFNMDKGYGFISPDQGGEDAFVHISAVERAGMATLQQNQRVGYELETGRNGRVSAVNLTAQD
jgi:CspA family cold shock protein